MYPKNLSFLTPIEEADARPVSAGAVVLRRISTMIRGTRVAVCELDRVRVGAGAEWRQQRACACTQRGQGCVA